MTLEEAKQLGYYQILHFYDPILKEKCERWRINGKVKLWKRSPQRIQIPLASGLYRHGYLTNSNCHFFHLESECEKQKR